MNRTLRELLDQLGHAGMAFAGAMGVGYLSKIWLSVDTSVTLGAIAGMFVGLVYELFQNISDKPDEKTKYIWWGLPVNSNMLRDFLGYFVGSLLFVIVAGIIM